MLMQKSYERHSSRRSRPIGRVTATLARARRPRWVDTLLIDSPSHTTQVEARGGAPPRVRVRVAVWMCKFSHVTHTSSPLLLPVGPVAAEGATRTRATRASLTLRLVPGAAHMCRGGGQPA